MTDDEPAARAFVMSPELRMPPSEITGMSWSRATLTLSITAVSCGTPEPVTTLVMHIEPEPTPTLTASTPALMRSFAPSPVATFPAISSQLGKAFFII